MNSLKLCLVALLLCGCSGFKEVAKTTAKNGASAVSEKCGDKYVAEGEDNFLLQVIGKLRCLNEKN